MKLPNCWYANIPIAEAVYRDLCTGEFTQKELATKHRVTTETIRRWVKECGWPAPKVRRLIKGDLAPLIHADLLTCRFTFAELRQRHGVDGHTIRAWIKANNWPRPKPQAHRYGQTPIPGWVLPAYESGESLKSIAERVGVARSTVGDWVRKFGWERKAK